MFANLHSIALRTARYSDKYSILSAYTLEMGRQSLLIPASGGKKASRYRALTMPLSAFECVASLTPGREVHQIRDIKPDNDCLNNGYDNPKKAVVSFFLAEFFSTILKEPTADRPMYNLMHSTIKTLSEGKDKEIANLHLLTLVRAATILGIEPDISTARKGSFFDMAEGIWRTDLSGINSSSLLGEKAVQALYIARMTPDNYTRYKFNRNQRNEALDIMIRYFHLHGFGKSDIPAINILRELFY